MARNEAKGRSTVRKALRDVTNDNRSGEGEGKFSKSASKKTGKIEGVRVRASSAEGAEDDCLDRLLLVHSNLSSLTTQIDQLVAQAFQLKAPSKEGRQEIASFTLALSDMISSLEPWIPRFQKALVGPSAGPGNQRGQTARVNDEEMFEVASPEHTKMDLLISPSPLVSWRVDCNNERGRQLFLLTPLPMPTKALSSRHPDLHESVFEKVAVHQAAEKASILTVSTNLNGLLEGVAMNPDPSEPCDSLGTEAESNVGCGFVSSPMVSKRDHSAIVMTPRLKTSPPKSCVLLEPISESFHKGNDRMRKSTPFPTGIRSQVSCSSSSEGSEDLASKYPELLGIQRANKSRIGKKELESSPDWAFSPPKTCVLLEPPNEKSLHASVQQLQINVPSLNQQKGFTIHDVQVEPAGGNFAMVESTPMWKEPESAMRTAKRPGENTLKRELWTKFDAASTCGLRLNFSSFGGTSKKGFLDMLDEVSCDGENLEGEDGFR